MIAEHDLYLDEAKQKVIVVKEGEDVPVEAAFVLIGKGGTVPPLYADMVKALDEPVVEPVVQVVPELPPLSLPPAVPEPVLEPKPAKSKAEKSE